jgi:hypothetical protein
MEELFGLDYLHLAAKIASAPGVKGSIIYYWDHLMAEAALSRPPAPEARLEEGSVARSA